jgi:hypothetical protein
MTEIALVACAKTKAPRPSPAATLYIFALFRKSVLAALDRTKTVYILSAAHGLVEPRTELAPYEKTLSVRLKSSGVIGISCVSREAV